MKRAIYLDDRERDLARRCFEYLHTELHSKANFENNELRSLALKWTRDDIADLLVKFQEPEEADVIPLGRAGIQVREV